MYWSFPLDSGASLYSALPKYFTKWSSLRCVYSRGPLVLCTVEVELPISLVVVVQHISLYPLLSSSS